MYRGERFTKSSIISRLFCVPQIEGHNVTVLLYRDTDGYEIGLTPTPPYFPVFTDLQGQHLLVSYTNHSTSIPPHTFDIPTGCVVDPVVGR